MKNASSYIAPIAERHKISMKYEPAYDKTYNKTCGISKDSEQPVHAPSEARILVYHCLDSLEAVKGTCDQRRL